MVLERAGILAWDDVAEAPLSLLHSVDIVFGPEETRVGFKDFDTGGPMHEDVLREVLDAEADRSV